MRFTLLATAAIVALFGINPAAHANLVTNGNFESVTVTGKSSFQNNVNGWTGGSNLTFIDFPGTADNHSYLSVYGPFAATSPAGGNFVEADGDPVYSSTFSQMINGLTVGQSYALSFYQAAGQQDGFTGSTTERWQVSFGTDVQLSTMYSLAQGGVGSWQLQSMSFVAKTTSQLLSFLAVGTPNGAPPISFLDGVSLDATSSAVPEPATLSLLGLGALGLIAARRRAKRA